MLSQAQIHHLVIVFIRLPIGFYFFMVMLQRQQVQRGYPDIPFPSDALQLLLGNPKVFPGQTGYIYILSCKLWVCPKTLRGRNLELSTQTSSNVEEHWLYSELHPDDGASHIISKAETGNPTEEANFSCLYPGCSSCHELYLMTIGETWNWTN